MRWRSRHDALKMRLALGHGLAMHQVYLAMHQVYLAMHQVYLAPDATSLRKRVGDQMARSPPVNCFNTNTMATPISL